MIRRFTFDEMPSQLQNIPSPPSELFMMGHDETALDTIMKRKRVAIVGTRRVSAYGRQVTATLSSELAAQGIVIVSGLAYGVDAIAHQAAVDANGLSIAVLPSPVEYVVPRNHTQLASRLLHTGGVLLSEYPKGTQIFPSNFVERNRIVTGISDALLIIEAAEDSGTLHTEKFARKQNIDVLVVPGNITSPTSVGTNNLLKGTAIAVTETQDILNVLNLPEHQLTHQRTSRVQGGNQQEQLLIDLLEQGIGTSTELLAQSGLSIEQFNHHLTMLEITAKIRPLGGNNWSLA